MLEIQEHEITHEITQEMLNEMFQEIGVNDTDEILNEMINLHVEIETITAFLKEKSGRFNELSKIIEAYWTLNQISKMEKSGHIIELKPIENFSISKENIEKIRPLLQEIGQEEAIKKEPTIHHKTLQGIMNRLTNADDKTYMIHYTVEELKKNYPDLNHYKGNQVTIKKSKKSK